MSKKIKVLFMARRFPPAVGGMERFAYEISTELEQITDLRKITWGGSNVWLPLVLPWFFLQAAWKLLTERDIAIIHAHDGVQAPVAWLLHVLFRKPYVLVVHGLDVTYKNAFYQTVVLPFIRHADVVITNSSATRDEALKRGVPSEKVHSIPLGTRDDYGQVTPDRAGLSKSLGMELEGRILLLTTGRLVKRKGAAWFITNVLPTLKERHGSILYLIAGEGGERPAIEAAIKEQGLSNHVALLGRVSDETRSLLYQSSDIFVMPNIVVPGNMEGFGIVAQEAATAELPVVASGIEGIVDALIDGKNGVLVPTRNSERFVEEIEKFIDDPDLRRRFGKRARSYTLRNYSWQRIARAYVELYEHLSHR